MLIENDSFVVLTYIISIDEVCELCKLNYIVLIFNHFREGKESDSLYSYRICCTLSQQTHM